MRTVNQGSEDDLAFIRKMVYDTKDNVDHHINVVGNLRDNLTNIHSEAQYFDKLWKHGTINQLKN